MNHSRHLLNESASAALVFVSIDSLAAAKSMAKTLVQEKLVACVHCLPTGLSIYSWQGEIQETEEVNLILKTRMALSEQVIARVKALHTYDVPEILVLPVRSGLPAYLDWINTTTEPITEHTTEKES